MPIKRFLALGPIAQSQAPFEQFLIAERHQLRLEGGNRRQQRLPTRQPPANRGLREGLQSGLQTFGNGRPGVRHSWQSDSVFLVCPAVPDKRSLGKPPGDCTSLASGPCSALQHIRPEEGQWQSRRVGAKCALAGAATAFEPHVKRRLGMPLLSA